MFFLNDHFSERSSWEISKLRPRYYEIMNNEPFNFDYDWAMIINYRCSVIHTHHITVMGNTFSFACQAWHVLSTQWTQGWQCRPNHWYTVSLLLLIIIDLHCHHRRLLDDDYYGNDGCGGIQIIRRYNTLHRSSAYRLMNCTPSETHASHVHHQHLPLVLWECPANHTISYSSFHIWCTAPHVPQ